jgi:hypothetical protein
VVPLGGSHFATPSPIQLKTPHSLPPTEHYKYGALSRYDDHDYEMPAPALTQDRRFSEQRRSITDSPYLSTPKLAPMGEPAGSPPHFAHLPGVSGIDSLELEGVGHAHVPSIVIDNGPSKFRPRDPLAYRQTSRSARRAASPYSTDHSRSYSMSMSRYAGRSQTLEPPQTLLPRSDFLPLAPPQTHRAGSVPPVAIPRLSSSSYPSKMAPSWDPTLSRAVSEAPMERSRPRWRTE